MAALTKARKSIQLGSNPYPALLAFPVKGNVKIFEGAIVVLGADGFAKPATAALGLTACGHSRGRPGGGGTPGLASTIDSTGLADGALTVEVVPGTRKWFSGGGGDAITVASGQDCYLMDDQTVGATDGGGTRSFAGRVIAVDADGGVYITIAPWQQPANPTTRKCVVTLPVLLANIANGVIARFKPGFAGTIKSISAVVVDPATTAAKLSSLHPAVAGVDCTGGVAAITSANMTPLANKVDGTAITAGAGFGATDEIQIVAAATTAFVEGQAVIEVTLG